MQRVSRLLAAGMLTAALALGQTSGTIQGTVTDDSGAVIPGAEVVVLSLETGAESSLATNEAGFYTSPGLNPGLYSVNCSSEGFAGKEYPEVRLEVQQTMRIDCALSVGSVTETVEVNAAAILIQSEKTEVGQVIDSKRILEMPLNGRNYLELAKFSVGVLPSREMGKGTRHDGVRGGEGGILAVGMNAAQTNVLLDGADNSSRNSGGALGFQAQATKPSVDAVGEFKVVTNNMSAEYGYRMGAKVIVSTKSGTNQFHGSVYEFLRNDKLDGTNFFANRVGADKPTLRRNQYGFTAGGPIVRNTLFGFFSFQGTKDRAGQSFTASVPSVEALGGDFSQQPHPDRDIFDPQTLGGGVRSQFPNNVIPRDRFDPVAAALLGNYPAPNIAGREHLRNNHFFSPSDTIDHNQYDMRFDWNVNNSNRWFARYSIRDEFVLQNGSLPLPANGGNGQTIDLPGQNWASALNTTLGPTKFNELRFGYTYFPTRFDIPFSEALNPQFGVLGAPGDSIDDGLDHGYALSIVSGFQNVGPRAFWPNVNKLDNLQISDNFTWVKGSHTIKVGAEYRRTQIPRSPSRFRRGQFQYTGVYTTEMPDVAASRGATGNALADGLLGWNANGRWGWPNGEEQVIPYWGFFVQDDWKISPRLTLNLGLRYELFLTPTFPDPQSHSLNSTVVRFIGEVNGRAIEPGERLSAANGGWGEAEYLPHFQTPRDSSDCACENDLNNFAPRIGLAYRVNDATVVRAGIGIFYGEHDNTGGESARFNTGAPQSNEFDNIQPRSHSAFFTRNGFPASTRAGLPRAGLNVNVKKDGVWPSFYAAQWFFDIQRELPGDALLTVGYNGSSTSQVHGAININRPLTPHPTARWQTRRIRPFFNSVSLRGVNFLNQNYNSLTVKGEKRFTKGFTFLSSFTWAHNIDVVNENLTTGTTAQQRFTYNQAIERGNASLDRRLAWVTSVVYELPFGPGKSALTSGPGAWILGGWQVGGILNLLGGTPDSHTFNQDTTNVGGANRGNLIGEINLPAAQRTIDRWFNTDAVGPGGLGVLDDAGRNLIWGPGTISANLFSKPLFCMMLGMNSTATKAAANEDWELLLSFFPDNWQALAAEKGALKGLRKDKSAEHLLRTLLLHLGCGHSLRETVVRARQASLADLSDVALLKRLRKAREWLYALCVELFREHGIAVSAAAGFQVRAFDATTVQEPGRTGALWRLHYSVNLPSLGCDFFKLTPTEGSGTGESFTQFPIRAGDYVLADRGYSTSVGLQHVAAAGGHVIVRVNTRSLVLEAADGQPFDLLACVETLRQPGALGVWPTRAVAKTGPPVAGRICALRKTAEAIEIAHRSLRRRASKRGTQLQPETLRFACYVIVFTTYPAEQFPASEVLEWYRLRWQVELVFKRFKSLAQFGHLPKSDEASAQAWLYGKLLVALLVEKIVQHAQSISPWGYDLRATTRPQPLA